MADLDATLAEILGPRGWLSGSEADSYRRDWLDRYGAEPLGVARPASTDEVSRLLAACRVAGAAVVPQGGNTGLCGASVCGRAGGVILSLARMTAIGDVDGAGGSVEVEAGVVLDRLHQTLGSSGLIFPMHLGAEGSAQIGGLIGTNAGGSHAARYGMMQDLVLGLEVVLADGSVWNGLRGVQKDNAGYQLRRLFCGAEGTLGIVTKAVLRLHPAPKGRATALLCLASADALVAFGARLRSEAGEFVNGLEFFCDLGLDLVLKNLDGIDFPLESRAPFYLLVELTASSAKVPLDEILEEVLTAGMEEGLVTDGALAQSEAQRLAFWRLREEQPEGQRLEGTQLKHDISVPPGKLARFIAEAAPLCEAILPGVRLNPFGHLGDGNVHYNLSPAAGAPDFAGHGQRFAVELGRLASELGGSFAAEHGLGRAKIALANALRGAVERDLMGRIKAAIDPAGILNPGVIVDPVLARQNVS
ncbi:FAD-binding oxidoreductase [Jiella sp. MQZ9-1]|uniref:FAD-binding oxidoreductase n=1 Tax=Jiella flava TaxID=2816857 RepID=A0A939JRZ4_9HYPH|nr:FAD-binding oxidoreductase [Jiella flava]MBO0662433.1 FAD-binding oxidoreductase [Jiella flava]MCD2471656.1 FAD-binding oxidoreductase [Jiella flava]